MKKNALISTVHLLAVLAVNFLANALPLNNLTTREVSDRYPNLFVPDGLTFSIWGLIYLLLCLFVVQQWRAAYRGDSQLINATNGILRWFWLSCLLNAGWIMAWHFLMPVVSWCIMIALLAVLTHIFLRLRTTTAHLSLGQRLVAHAPFVIYFAWICVATAANTTAVLVHLQWGAMGWPHQFWAISLVAVVCLLASWIVLRFDEPIFALVVAWALFGLQRKEYGVHTTVAHAALIGAIACILLAGYKWLFPRKLISNLG